MTFKNDITKGKGFTLLEILLVLGIVTVLLAAILPLFGTMYRSWQTGMGRGESLGSSRQGMKRIITELNEATIITQKSSNTSIDGSITITKNDGKSVTMKREFLSSLNAYALTFNGTPISYPIESLKFIGYTEGLAEQTEILVDISYIRIEIIASDQGKVGSYKLVSGISLGSRSGDQIISATCAINEVHYNPTGSTPQKTRREYIELHNISDAPIDLYDWRIYIGTDTPDLNNSWRLRLHSGVGTSTVIPAGGYAFITIDNFDSGYLTVAPYSCTSEVWLKPIDSSNNDIADMALPNKNGTITLFSTQDAQSSFSNFQDQISYDRDWGGNANNKSLERKDPLDLPSDPTNWWDSGTLNPSPGRQNSP